MSSQLAPNHASFLLQGQLAPAPGREAPSRAFLASWQHEIRLLSVCPPKGRGAVGPGEAEQQKAARGTRQLPTGP